MIPLTSSVGLSFSSFFFLAHVPSFFLSSSSSSSALHPRTAGRYFKGHCGCGDWLLCWEGSFHFLLFFLPFFPFSFFPFRFFFPLLESPCTWHLDLHLFESSFAWEDITVCVCVCVCVCVDKRWMLEHTELRSDCPFLSFSFSFSSPSRSLFFANRILQSVPEALDFFQRKEDYLQKNLSQLSATINTKRQNMQGNVAPLSTVCVVPLPPC